MNRLLRTVVLTSSLFLPPALPAAIVLGSGPGLNLPIPDNDQGGVIDTLTVLSMPEAVDSLTVFLDVGGGWNGDLYAYLEHDGVLAMLLNRPGRTAIDSTGAATSGFTVTFDDQAAADAHNGFVGDFGQAVTGTFQPDARLADPDLVLDTSPRSAFLNSFHNQNGVGDWTLFVADLGAGDTATLRSWSLSFTLVPEPSSVCIVLAAGGSFLAARRRRPSIARQRA